jgi:hypothetical protein
MEDNSLLAKGAVPPHLESFDHNFDYDAEIDTLSSETILREGAMEPDVFPCGCGDFRNELEPLCDAKVGEIDPFSPVALQHPDSLFQVDLKLLSPLLESCSVIVGMHPDQVS